ncbi:MAG: hypothetical protein HQK50_16395 [Oligoflexia bacterium]|nr:hypothetical protein [Oligoflexia bacterium]
MIPKLQKDKHYSVDLKNKVSVLTDAGIIAIQEMLNINGLFESKHALLLQNLNQALRVWTLFSKNVDYVVKEGRIIIVDEFTGRLKDSSRWSDGLHQAIEAKEGVEVKAENQTLASITFQNYFRLYSKLAGMTGTADTEAEEFSKIYKLEVVVVPPHLPMIREDLADVIYRDKNTKYSAVVNLIKELYEKGRPVLVGTISIETSELISERLHKLQIPHEVLNAKHHEREAKIISNAGQKAAVTIATNMAGRGTDIKLTAETVQLGGLYILGTERHESRRIDHQLRGRSGRQGDAGSSKFFISLEDDLMKIFSPDKVKNIMRTLGSEDLEEKRPLEHRKITKAIAETQKKVEVHHFNIRKHLLDYDNVMNEQRKSIYSLRREILSDEGNMDLLQEMIEDVVAMIVEEYRPKASTANEGWPFEKMNQQFQAFFHNDHSISELECHKRYKGGVMEYLTATAQELLAKKFSSYAPPLVQNALREILLSILDHYWRYHLLNVDHLQEGVSLKAYAQQDPLVAYKRESYLLFEQMKIEIKKAVVATVFAME